MSLAEDFNGDFLQDMIIISFGNPPMLLLGNGKGDFTDATSSSGLSQFTGYWFTLAVDLDNNGSKDLIIQDYDQEAVLKNDGKGHFTDMTDVSGISDPAQTQSISAGDLNNDGYPEILFTNWNAAPTLFRNNGNGTFSYTAGPWNFIYSRMAAIVDLNGDGLKDIIVARYLYDDKSLIFMNLGNMTFASAAASETQIARSFFCDAADINNDGRPDLIMDQLESFSLLLNDGGKFSDHTELLVDMKDEMLFGALGASARPKFVDLNDDGLLDIYSQQVVYINQGCNTKKGVNDVDPSGPPLTFSLLQNYPNPFNPVTTLQFQIPRTSNVLLRIFDLLGREVVTLLNETKNAGRYSVVWDAARCASGVYFARLQSGEHIQTMKMLYMK
jgi:hypothetical protein